MRQLLGEHAKIYIYQEPVDMRKSYDSLFKLVRNSDLFDGGIFVFVAKNRKRVKALLWNKKGLMILMQRLEEGRFADIFRRKSLTRDEFLNFFEGDPAIRKIELPNQKTLASESQILQSQPVKKPLKHGELLGSTDPTRYQRL